MKNVKTEDVSIDICQDPSNPLKEIPVYNRTILLRRGDIFCVNAQGIKESLGIKIKDIKFDAKHIWPNIICIEKIKRKWWQIWKPKYIAAKFMCVADG